MFELDQARIGVVGLGYVGLPLAVAFGRRADTIGYDIQIDRIAELKGGRDSTLEVDPADLAASEHLSFTSDAAELEDCNVYIVTVPTPIDPAKQPDLRPLESASRTVGRVLRGILSASDLAVAASETAWRALLSFGQGKADYADYVIGAQNRAFQALPTYTFDAKAPDHPDFSLVDTEI